MLKNYVRIAFRNIVRHKAFAAIHIAGLMIGMTCSMLILLRVQHELSRDRFHKNSGETYRVVSNPGDFKATLDPAPLLGVMQTAMPVIKNSVRVKGPVTSVFEVGDRKFE
jgi:hypothetical protein